MMGCSDKRPVRVHFAFLLWRRIWLGVEWVSYRLFLSSLMFFTVSSVLILSSVGFSLSISFLSCSASFLSISLRIILIGAE